MIGENCRAPPLRSSGWLFSSSETTLQFSCSFEEERIGRRKFGAMRDEDFQILGRGARGHLRRALSRNRKTLFDGSSTYGTRDQTYLEEKIRLEGAAENVAEVERNEAAESLPNRWMNPTVVLSNES